MHYSWRIYLAQRAVSLQYDKIFIFGVFKPHLRTMFMLFRGGQFYIGGGNRSSRRKPSTFDRKTDNLS